MDFYIPPNTSIDFYILVYTTIHFKCRISETWGPTWDTQMVVARTAHAWHWPLIAWIHFHLIANRWTSYCESCEGKCWITLRPFEMRIGSLAVDVFFKRNSSDCMSRHEFGHAHKWEACVQCLQRLRCHTHMREATSRTSSLQRGVIPRNLSYQGMKL